jgi:hypothetical protein
MKKPKAPGIVTMAIFTTITIVAWVFFSVYRALTVKPPVSVPQQILQPINPELDIMALDRLERGIFFEEEEIVEFSTEAAVPTVPPTTEEAVEEEIATEEAEIIEVEEATESGEI